VLTPAEWRITNAVRHGMSSRQIARRAGISVDAVKYHVANAIAKLGLPDRAALRGWPGVPADSSLTASDLAGPSAPNAATAEPGRTTMTNLTLGPLGQVSRHVADISQATGWYRDVLGLPHLYSFGDLAFFDCAGTRLFLSVPDDNTPVSTSTILYFRVHDIHRAYRELQARGVEFEGAPHMIHRHDSGVEEWMAFFTDPDGQPLAIMTQTQS
jgi:catechol 2,3-dioxygenase-like lactoylglutathione lyase family enzyme